MGQRRQAQRRVQGAGGLRQIVGVGRCAADVQMRGLMRARAADDENLNETLHRVFQDRVQVVVLAQPGRGGGLAQLRRLGRARRSMKDC